MSVRLQSTISGIAVMARAAAFSGCWKMGVLAAGRGHLPLFRLPPDWQEISALHGRHDESIEIATARRKEALFHCSPIWPPRLAMTAIARQSLGPASLALAIPHKKAPARRPGGGSLIFRFARLLDLDHPAEGVFLLAQLDAGEPVVEPLAELAGLAVAHGDVRAPVVDGAHRADHRGGASAKGLVQLARFLGFDHLVDGQLALADGNAPVLAQGDDRVAGDPGQDGAGERAGDDFAVDDEEHVHGAHFLDALLVAGVQPQHLGEALGVGLFGGQQAGGVVAHGLGLAHAAGRGAHVLLLHVDLHRIEALGVIGPHRPHDHVVEVLGADLDPQAGLGGDDRGPDVEAGALQGGHPLVLGLDQLEQMLQRLLGRQLGDAQAAVGAVHALDVGHGPEHVDAAVHAAVGLEPLKDLLAVVQHQRGRVQAQGAVGGDARVMPTLALVIIHQVHVVAEYLAETQLGLVFRLGLAAVGGQQLLGTLHDALLGTYIFSSALAAAKERLQGGLSTPFSVMIAVTRSLGVTSKARLMASLPLAAEHPAKANTSPGSRSSMGINSPLGVARSMVLSGAATQKGTPWRRACRATLKVPILLATSPLAAMRSAPTTHRSTRPLSMMAPTAPSGATTTGMPSSTISQAVSRAPCNRGRVSSAMTLTCLPASWAARTTPRAVPQPPVAREPALQWVRMVAFLGTSLAPCLPMARLIAMSSASISSLSRRSMAKIVSTSSGAKAATASMRSTAQARFTAVGRAARITSARSANCSRHLAGSLTRMAFAASTRPMAAATPMAGAPRTARVWMQQMTRRMSLQAIKVVLPGSLRWSRIMTTSPSQYRVGTTATLPASC
eukprot:TRINITY_DN7455_c1_g2_i1.p1 TRINITY_DN7455_c1_g2~~TRINITY_DN7455_c1_g2_i1.p1  ORF type:complete len:841 (-),score=220.45 TRINITY_DN7455_c1_g2_i1:648-3170(-)